MGSQPESFDHVHAASGLGAPDDGEADIASLGSQRGHSFQQISQALQCDVSRRGGDEPTGPPSDALYGSKEVRVNPNGYEAHPIEVNAHVGVDVLDGVLAHDDDTGHPRGHLALHAHKGIPTPD